ncbi:hypothetical protein EJB05_03229, partial [Eragrostis curvula]
MEEEPLVDLGLEEKNGTAPPAWYDAPDIEPSYRHYLLTKMYGTSMEARSAAGNNDQEEVKEAEIEEEEDLKEAQMGAGLPMENAEGAICPEHINERPDSDFKRRLIQVLVKEADRE